ncbi:MAG TPA: uracil-DNA glycosylase family protein [Novosphingobium sp.]|nr:uracil-DNA glycosylase family protein [Novosphingobium sp.]
MDASIEQDFAAALAGALDWWRDAGVDLDYRDEPKRWIAERSETAAPVEVVADAAPLPPPKATVATDRSGWPTELGQFAEWWMQEPNLDRGMAERRVPPRGPAHAAVMVLIEQPEAGDGERLLSGAEGRLLDAMLVAMGIAPDQAYLASVLPRHTPMPDWAAVDAEGLAKVTAHHIALAAPQRLIVFGSNILPLLGHDPANKPDSSRAFNHESLTIPLLPAMSLTALLATPRRKAALWRDWLEWTGTKD